MNLYKFSPSISLSPYVREYMIIESENGMNNTLIPDTYLVLAIRLNGSIVFYEGAHTTTPSLQIISGLQNAARQLSYTKGTSNFLIVFREGGLAAFSKMPAHELYNQTVDAGNVFSSELLEAFTEKIQEAATHAERAKIADDFLQQQLIRTDNDPLIQRAVQLIQQQHGIIKVKELAASLHISQDPFEKKFRTYIGTSPKKYASIIRIRNIIEKIPSYTSLTDAGYEAGYYDQSHFIKEFRAFTGQTPKEFLRSPRRW
ncbi:helix-turn-helix transcriptional regulator [Pseudoflavitalea sp. G-6-1-2]|uniref:helix-turn-helix domain-containing protein n=1 Tax=Pseudoflavitalea sp. G-6-1-2 TaxID=2728841 RepID=UPI00146A8CFA|nr:helix-turn-helix domain-containing protein [Pseudoflavitalea sp. G-6-1-2]NML19555.1 helix-turn-helix transcriptional regulator [Pseudoflavitalea sp. G-6-1-2]